MNFTLFKTTLRQNGILLLIFLGVLAMYLATMLSMYNPDDIDALVAMLKLLPDDMLKAMGFSSTINSLTTYLASWLYGLLMLGFPMVYCIILGNRLVAKMVDDHSFAYLLSTPNARATIIITQGVYAVLSLAALFAACFGIGTLLSGAMFPGLLDVPAFLSLNVTTMLANLLVMMIAFFFSCLFNDTKWSLGFGSGIPIMFLLMKMMGGVSDKADILRKLSIYGFYDPVELVQGTGPLVANLAYLGASIALFVAAVLIFRKKRLPL